MKIPMLLKKFFIVILGICVLFLLFIYYRRAEADQGEIFQKYFMENYEMDHTKAVCRMFIADVTQDGTEEMIVISQEYITSGQKRELGGGAVEVFAVIDHKVVEIWSYPIQHAQDMFLFLNGRQKEHYFLQYFPTEYQGICTYHYRIFYLNDKGEVIVMKEEEAEQWNVDAMSEEELRIKKEAFWQQMENELSRPYTLVYKTE